MLILIAPPLCPYTHTHSGSEQHSHGESGLATHGGEELEVLPKGSELHRQLAASCRCGQNELGGY